MIEDKTVFESDGFGVVVNDCGDVFVDVDRINIGEIARGDNPNRIVIELNEDELKGIDHPLALVLLRAIDEFRNAESRADDEDSGSDE